MFNLLAGREALACGFIGNIYHKSQSWMDCEDYK